MQVRILGPLELTVAGDPVELSSGTQRAVLVALALRAGRPVPAEAVVDAVWGDDPPPSARSSLQAHLSRLRRTLAEHDAGDVIVTRTEGYVLDVEVDAGVFEQEVVRARAALGRGEASAAAEVLRRALRAWRGVALEDAGDHASVEASRRRLETLRLEATEMWLRAEIETGNDVITEAEALVAEQPLRETAWALLMQGLARAGRHAEALHVYGRARETFAEELGVGPGPELREVHAALLRADAEAEAARPATRSNLPMPLTSFVGRGEQVTRLVEQVTSRRLVTIVGIGGAGKTRLAVEVGRRTREAFPDGVWFVDLTAATHPEQVAGAVADAIGVRESSDEPLEDRLVTVLRTARSLVVLDNCEHLIDACARFADGLLRRCEELTILATSREPLAIPGEVLHEIGGLELPTGEDPVDAEAVRLLLDRAADAAPDAVLDRGAAEQVCRQLDGLPLAIEIVAPHLRTMPIEEIAEQLEGRFRLLAPGSRVAPDRHRTLDGAIAWSCELITPGERELLGRLAVFSGSFAADAVEAVCGDAEMLPRLTDRSLVVAEPGGRFRLLETVRAYAREHLLPAEEPLQERLVSWAAALVATAESELTGEGQRAWLDRLELEQDNLRAALDFAHASGEPGAVARIAVPQLLFWIIRSRMIEGRTWLERAVEGCPADDALRLRALNALTVALENVSGPSTDLDRTLSEARELATKLGDDRQAAWNLCWSGLIAVWTDLDRAADELRRAAAAFEDVGDRWGQGLAGSYLAFVERFRGDHAEAERVALAAEGVVSGLGGRWVEALCRTTRGVLARHRGDLPEARRLLEGALETFLALDSPDGAIICLQGLALTSAKEGDLARSRDLMVQALDLARRAGSVTHVAENMTELGWIALRMGEPEEAVAWLWDFAHEPNASRWERAMASALDLAGRLMSTEDARRATQLHGLADRVRARLGEDPRPEQASRIDAGLQELRQALSEEDFAAAWEEDTTTEPLDALRTALSRNAASPRPPGSDGTA